MNYIALQDGIPSRMHFTDDYLVERTIKNRDTGKPKRVKSLVFQVDELNGEPVSRTFSILSDKLRGHFEAVLKDQKYRQYDFIITQIGDEFLRDWIVEPVLRRE